MTFGRERAARVIGTCFGLGLAPIAPGTFAALVGVAIFIAIRLAAPPAAHGWLIALALVVSCVLTVAMTPWAERHWGKKDPGNFVLDEVAGFLMTVLLFRPLEANLALLTLWAFLVTRVIDIIKVPPANYLEKLPGGWGVLADDLWGSLYAAGALHLAYRWMPAIFGV